MSCLQEYESQKELLLSMESQLKSVQHDFSRSNSMLESNSSTITTLTQSLEVEKSKVQSLEAAIQAQQAHLQQAISSPTLQRHTPQKDRSSKVGSNVKEKVEMYETHIFSHSASSPSTCKSAIFSFVILLK